MRPALLALALLAACTDPGRDPGGLSAWPRTLFGGAPDSAEQARRGAVELVVKANHPALLAEIAAGGGATLTRAMAAAAIPPAERATRLIQLNADLPLYAANPGALVTALVVWGS